MEKKQALIFGTISRNMVKRRREKKDTKKIEKIQLSHKDMIDRRWTLYISYDENSYSKFHLLQDQVFTSKDIKAILVKDIARTLKDLEWIQNAEIPQKPFHKCNIKMQAGYIVISVFPSQTPTELLCNWLSLDSENKERVIWSTFSESDHSLSEEFLCTEETTYQDFLIFFSNHVSNVDSEGYRIDYELFVFNIPVVFGKATFISNSTDYTFFFSRIVLSSSMPKEYYRLKD